MKFKIGDRVRVINDKEDILERKFKGKEGKIIRINECIGMEFDENINGHSCSGIGKSGHCMNVYAKNIELITEPKSKEYTLIITNTNKTILINKLTGKKGIATCHPDDKFDVSVGVKLAMDRLNGVEEVKTTPRKIGDLPIGTKIKILKETQSWGKVNAGDIGSISKHSVYCTEINFSNQSNWSIESDVLEHEYFEVVDESNISSAKEYIDKCLNIEGIKTINNMTGFPNVVVKEPLSFDDKVKLVKSIWDDFIVEMKK